MWGMSPFGNDWYTGGIGAKMPNANKVIVATVLKAGKKVLDLCRQCCCREVKLSFVQISRKGEVVNPPTDKEGLPALRDAVFGCPGAATP